MAGEEPRYASYLLRVWQAEENGELVWRASLESTANRGRLNFASLEALTAFLVSHLEEQMI
jgi:hypothetical protein